LRPQRRPAHKLSTSVSICFASLHMCMYIVFQTGQARWADTGTVLFAPVRKRPGPAATVPVPGPRCQHDGTARARPASASGTGAARPQPLDGAPRLLTVGSRGRVGRLYKPAAAAPLLALRLLAFQTLSHSSFRPLSPFQPHRALRLSHRLKP